MNIEMKKQCCALGRVPRCLGVGVALGCLLSAVTVESANPTHPGRLAEQVEKLGYRTVVLQGSGSSQPTAQAVFADTKLSLLVDSGWSVTALDERVARDWKTAAQTGARIGDALFRRMDPASVVVLENLHLGSTTFPAVPMLLRSLKRGSGLRQDGVLGGDFLGRNFSLFDCGGRRLHVREFGLIRESREVLESFLRAKGYEAIGLRNTGALVFACEVKIAGQTVNLLVDTGAAATVIDQDSANRLGLDPDDKRGRAIRGAGRIGSSWLYQTQIGSLGLGGITLTNLTIGVSDLSRWGIAGDGSRIEGVDGLMGMDVLGRSQAVIDYQGGKLWVSVAVAK